MHLIIYSSLKCLQHLASKTPYFSGFAFTSLVISQSHMLICPHFFNLLKVECFRVQLLDHFFSLLHSFIYCMVFHIIYTLGFKFITLDQTTFLNSRYSTVFSQFPLGCYRDLLKLSKTDSQSSFQNLFFLFPFFFLHLSK